MIVDGFKDTVRYVPTWNGNKKLPATEQVQCVIRVPTVTESQAYSTYIHGTDGTKVRIDMDAIMRSVETVEHLEIKSRGVHIKTGSEVLKYQELYGLADEIAGYVLNLGK